MQPAVRRLLFLGWVILGSLVLLEVVLQVGAWAVRPGAPPAPADADGYVVLAVGDSWVAGAEAPAGEGFVDGLARSLPGALDRPVSVLNRGRPGANSAYVALTVLDEAEDAGADLILVLVGQNNATNFAGVAEVEERLAGRERAPESGPRAELRTVKLARIVWANLRGTEGYREEIGEVEEGAVAIPELLLDVEGRPVIDEPLLETEAGRDYLERRLGDVQMAWPSREDGPWGVLFAALTRRPAPAAALSATRARADEGDVLARYALLRDARERGDWSTVKRWGDALADGPRGALADLGAAEAALLAGDWRRARDLLTAAAHQAPGLADVSDLACRFPPEASDVRVQEHCEREVRGATFLDRARIAEGTLQPEAAVVARRAWVERATHDLGSRVDLAVALAARGQLADADSLMGHEGAPDTVPPPVRPGADHWRYYVLRNAETGDRVVALEAATQALATQSTGEPHADLLHAIASVLAEHEACNLLPDVVDRWYRVRGDVVGAARLLGACMSPGDAAARLNGLASAWGADPTRSFDALARAGNRPLALLERDLDLVLEEAQRIGARVVLLDYPNPSEDHEALADLIAEYAASRAVPRIALRDRFAARLAPDAWGEHIAPNGHCNARGYALMAEIITAQLPPLLALGASP